MRTGPYGLGYSQAVLAKPIWRNVRVYGARAGRIVHAVPMDHERRARLAAAYAVTANLLLDKDVGMAWYCNVMGKSMAR